MLANTKTALQRFAKHVVSQSRGNLTRQKKNVNKKLWDSVGYDLKVHKNSFSLKFIMEEYGIFQDKGVRGADPSSVKNGKQKAPLSPFSFRGKKPPMQPIADWAKARHIRFRQGKMVNGKWKSTGRYAKGNYITIAFWLQNRIFAQGLKPSLFFTKPYVKAFENLPEEVIEAFGLDVSEFIKFTKE